MNVFVLSTGRTGTMSLERACRHINNYSCAHESRCSFLEHERFAYPADHIEIDNRLSWFLGRLEEAYGDDAIYIHMLREPELVAKSYLKRWNRETGIIRAYAYGILKRQEHEIADPYHICQDYVHTVNSNISSFLKNKSKTMEFELENAASDFPKFWELINATGNYEKAFNSFSEIHNTSGQSEAVQNEPIGKLLRIIKKMPSFLKNA